MRMASGRWSAFARLATSALFAATCQAFVEMPYADQQFGPDGPWQGVSLDVRYTGDSDFIPVIVYPGAMWGTIAALYLPTKKVCSGSSYDACVSGGTFPPLPPSNDSVGYSWYTYYNTDTDFYYYLNGSTAYTDLQFPNNIQMSSALTDVLTIGEMTYPSGITLPIEIGYGCLGGNPLTQAENAPLALYTGDLTQSNSYGLHVGSAPLGYKGSLIWGGYDRGRVIGPYLTYDAHQTLNLVDVTIGVEAGDSPFDGFDSQDNLLDVPASSGYTGYLPTLLKPEYPYIFLNKETIDKIAPHLPITFNSQAGYWLWNTEDPSYEKIVSGAGYLGFVFPAQYGNTAQNTIKVPFKLLNLTLEAAASGLGSDKAYFPIMQTQVGTEAGFDILLGRAFLQAAFFGTNWGQNTSFLAQAPGPGANGDGLGYNPVDMDYSATTLTNIRTGDNLFAQSWDGHWTVLSSNNGGSTGGDSSGGLSGGAIGGIIGGVVGGLAVVGAIIAFLLIRRKRKARQAAGKQHQTDYAPPGQEYAPGTPGFGPQGHGQPQGAAPPYGGAQPYYTDKPQHYEMGAEQSDRQEMDANEWYAKQAKQPGAPNQPEERYEMSANIQSWNELPGHEPQEMPTNTRTQ